MLKIFIIKVVDKVTTRIYNHFIQILADNWEKTSREKRRKKK
jgi:hypothetical protein